jgi:hypothetical protein
MMSSAIRSLPSKRARLCLPAVAFAVFVLVGYSPSARASLGSNAGSIETDRVQMHANIKTPVRNNGYQVQEMQLPGGTIVDEYVSPAGQVFAVTWHGQFLPPMQQILGTFFQQYSTALQSQQKAAFGHRPLDIEQSGLVFQTGGHMRAHYGRAYLPGQIPQGVALSQIQ